MSVLSHPVVKVKELAALSALEGLFCFAVWCVKNECHDLEPRLKIVDSGGLSCLSFTILLFH